MTVRKESASQLSRSLWVAIAVCIAGFASAQTGDRDAGPTAFEGERALIRGLLDEGRYQEAEARARQLFARAETQAGPESLEVGRVLDLLVEALWRQASGGEDEAQAFAQRAVAIKEASLGPVAVEVGDSLVQLGQVHHQLHDLETLDAVFSRAKRIYDTQLDPIDPRIGSVLSYWGAALYRQGEVARARPMLEDSLSISEKVHGRGSVEVAEGLQNLANLITETDEPLNSLSLYERSLDIFSRQLGPNHPRLAAINKDFGMTLLQVDDLVGGRSRLEASVAIYEAAGLNESGDYAGSLINLAISYSATGDGLRAEALYRRALEVAERADNRYAAAVALGNLFVGLKGNSVRLAEARAAGEEALAYFIDFFGPEHIRVAWMKSQLGDMFLRLGDYSAARVQAEAALALLEKLSGGDSRFMRRNHLTLGKIEHYEGRDSKARAHFAEARDVATRLWGAEDSSVGRAARQFGLFLLAIGDFEGALRQLQDAYRISLNAVGDEHNETLGTLRDLARVRAALGERSVALELLRQALSAQEAHLDPWDPDIAATLIEIASLCVELCDVDEALGFALRAEEISRHNNRLTLAALSERGALKYSANRMTGQDLAFSIAVRGSASQVSGAFDSVIRSRALILDEMATRRRLLSAADDDHVSRLADELIAARTRLASLTIGGVDNLPADQYEILLAEAAEERDRIERELAGRSAVFRTEQALMEAGLVDVTGALEPATALVSYVRYRDARFGAEPGGDQPLRLSYAAFVIPVDQKDPVAVPLGSAERVDEAIDSVRRALDAVASDPSRAAQAERGYRRAAEELRRLVWDPIHSLIENANQVFVVLDGPLNLVNLAALPQGSTEYLVESSYRIHYLSAERDLVRDSGSGIGGGLLALGNPDFDSTDRGGELAVGVDAPAPRRSSAGRNRLLFRGSVSSCGEFEEVRFDPLPASAREVSEVARLWAQTRGDELLTRLEGPEATELAFKSRAKGKRVLHLATHGFFLGDACREAPTAVLDANPLLMSGLALAGANQRSEGIAGGEDGILTAEEIAALDLSGVDLAVVSACESGLGRIQSGEGVLGLRRAFQVAGVNTLITSLWAVDDEATKEWMEELYRKRFVEQLSVSEAVHEATAEVLGRRRADGESTHPFFWAGFVAAGGSD